MTKRLAGPLILVPRNLVPMQESRRKFSLGLFRTETLEQLDLFLHHAHFIQIPLAHMGPTSFHSWICIWSNKISFNRIRAVCRFSHAFKRGDGDNMRCFPLSFLPSISPVNIRFSKLLCVLEISTDTTSGIRKSWVVLHRLTSSSVVTSLTPLCSSPERMGSNTQL